MASPFPAVDIFLPHAGFSPCCGRRTASSGPTPPSSTLLPGCNDHPSESSVSCIIQNKYFINARIAVYIT